MTTAIFDHPLPSARTSSAAKSGGTGNAGHDPLHAVLAKHDDRLLRDVGLTREDVVGPGRTFWAEWRRNSESWDL